MLASRKLPNNLNILHVFFNIGVGQGAEPRQIRDENENHMFPDALEEKSQDKSMLICIRGCRTLQVYQLRAQKITDRQTDSTSTRVRDNRYIYIHKKSDMLLHFRI